MKNIFLHTLILIACSIVSLGIGAHFYYYSPLYQRVTKAESVIHPTKGNSLSGVVNFEEKKDGLHITARMHGLTPGKHGFHVHEFGDCSCEDAVCAGAHFNPTNNKHGGPKDSDRHVGDLGNVIADSEGNAIYELIDQHTTLNGPHSIIGRSLIVHADPDDYVSQPTGNAGARIGCGVIGIAKN